MYTLDRNWYLLSFINILIVTGIRNSLQLSGVFYLGSWLLYPNCSSRIAPWLRNEIKRRTDISRSSSVTSYSSRRSGSLRAHLVTTRSTGQTTSVLHLARVFSTVYVLK